MRRTVSGEIRELARWGAHTWARRRPEPPPTPDRTGFYALTDAGPGPRGQLLGHETLATTNGSRRWRIRYRTIDGRGEPVVASAALAAHDEPATARRPIVLWVHGAAGVAPGCGPSRVGFDAWYADDYLQAGAVVVAPDLTGLGMEGPLHPYLHGVTAGHSVLDAARAATALTPCGAGPTVALAGHSAGGHAVLWANELAAGPDGSGLDVRLTVAISPITDLTAAMTDYATRTSMAYYAVMLVATWPSVEDVAAELVLTPKALARLDHVRADRLGALSHVFWGHGSRWLRVDGFGDPAWADALARQSAGHRPGASPVLLAHGDADDAVAIAWTRALAADGPAHELREYPGADHMSVHDAARADVVGRILAAVT